MRIETPDHFMGEPIPKDAIEIALAAEKKKKDGNGGEAPPLEGFIYVPSVNLYVAKEKSHLGKNWYDTHRELHKQNLRMPTIPQFIEFLKYLRVDPTAENTSIYDEITEFGNPWRTEHLDAKFYAKGDKLWIAYNHIVDSDGDLIVQDHEKLEGYLMQDKTPGIRLEHWLNNPTKQGLPQENSEQGDLWYWNPVKNKVAGFVTGPEVAYLSCDANPGFSDSKLGVRAVMTRTQNSGEKQ